MKDVIELKKSKYYREGQSEEVWERRSAAVWRKIVRTGSRLPFVEDLIALYRFMGAREVPWTKKALAAAGLLYFLAPMDAVVDYLPIVGYLDDAGVIAMVIAYLQSELKPFRGASGEASEASPDGAAPGEGAGATPAPD